MNAASRDERTIFVEVEDGEFEGDHR
jgi:hypothetical protein